MKQEKIFKRFLLRLEENLNILPDKSEETPENTLCALWAASAGNFLSPIIAEKANLPQLTNKQLSVLENLIEERLHDVPLAHLTNRQHFMGMEFVIKKGLYIPRKETELLAKTAISYILKDYKDHESINVIDVCTGIGTVAFAIANYCKNSQVYGSDIYGPAIDCAKTNAKHFNLENRSSFFNADLFEPFEKLSLKNNTQVVVSAPPYITSPKVKKMAYEISKHEPKEAFDAGPFGLAIFTKLISGAIPYLHINGYLMFECGLGQGEFLAKRIRSNKNYKNVVEIRDENENVRVLSAQKA